MKSLTEQAKDLLLAALLERVSRAERDAIASAWGAEPGGDLLVGIRGVLSREAQARREAAAATASAEACTLASQVAEVLALPCRVQLASHRTITLRARLPEARSLTVVVTARREGLEDVWCWHAAISVPHCRLEGWRVQYGSGRWAGQADGAINSALTVAIEQALRGDELSASDREKLEGAAGRLKEAGL